MKFSVITLALCVVIGFAFVSPKKLIAQQSSLRIMTYNLRYDNPEDAPNNWDNRKQKVAHLIKFYQPTFLGTQEALYHQLNYLDQQLSNYSWIGEGRKDGKKAGEFSALLYNTDKATLVAKSDSTIWLSKTPSKPSKSWDAALPRILTWGQFKLKENGKTLFVFNTHFDHIGEKARAESAQIILQTIRTIAGKAPVVLTGDFNVTEGSKPYKILTSSFLGDTYYTSSTPDFGPDFTYNGFSVADTSDRKRIDYIFANPGVDVRDHATISSFKNDYYPSDHLPVITDITIK